MKRRKRLWALCFVLSALLCLCSCDSIFFAKADALILPPVLFENQNEIMQALKKSAGEHIVLEYPGSGENRTAFLFCDLDGDARNEAVAFYRPAGEELRQDVVHMNVLDRSEEGWNSLCDVIGEAAGIDRVCVGTFSGQRELIVGWELMRDREKTLMCYSLSGGSLKRDYSTTYIDFSVADFWAEREGDELITLNYAQQSENLLQPSQHARLISKAENGFGIFSTTPLDSRVTGYRSCAAGKYDRRAVGCFLDGLLDTSTVNTQILTVRADGALKNPLLQGGQTGPDNMHRLTLLSQDVDGDGIFEVPHQEPIVGYESVPESERLYKTVWQHLENGQLQKSSAMHISTTLGIRITLSPQLEDKVTLRLDMAHSELNFYTFQQSLGQSIQALFSLKVCDRENLVLEDGYSLLCQNDFTAVLVRFFDSENALCPDLMSLSELVKIM